MSTITVSAENDIRMNVVMFDILLYGIEFIYTKTIDRILFPSLLYDVSEVLISIYRDKSYCRNRIL